MNTEHYIYNFLHNGGLELYEVFKYKYPAISKIKTAYDKNKYDKDVIDIILHMIVLYAMDSDCIDYEEIKKLVVSGGGSDLSEMFVFSFKEFNNISIDSCCCYLSWYGESKTKNPNGERHAEEFDKLYRLVKEIIDEGNSNED